jgi:CRISPR/Cas system Type II protein with McrA/HNH and RuvC-like nuclease domain
MIMTMKEIPDIKYELVDDGSLINIEQGFLDPVCVSLHKIHIKHIADLMKVGAEDDEASPVLVDYLEQINEQATKLFEFLDAIPNSHPRDIEPECLVMARKLKGVANQALSYWGNN